MEVAIHSAIRVVGDREGHSGENGRCCVSRSRPTRERWACEDRVQPSHGKVRKRFGLREHGWQDLFARTFHLPGGGRRGGGGWLLRLLGVWPRGLCPGDEGAEIAGHSPGLLQTERAPERRHNRSTAF